MKQLYIFLIVLHLIYHIITIQVIKVVSDWLCMVYFMSYFLFSLVQGVTFVSFFCVGFFLIGLQQGGKLNADSVLLDCRYLELHNFSKNASTS